MVFDLNESPAVEEVYSGAEAGKGEGEVICGCDEENSCGVNVQYFEKGKEVADDCVNYGEELGGFYLIYMHICVTL